MPHIDRYILKQLFFPFLFFLLIFTGILWFNRSLSILDFVAQNRQPAVIFLELCAYLLPPALHLALPISGFAAAAFVTNRLISESELTVMMATGRSVLRLAAPFGLFGVICFMLVSLMGHWLLPLAHKKFNDRQNEIAREYITQIVKVGEFITRDNRSTFYFGSKDGAGNLTDIMIAERIDEAQTVTHFAQSGKILTVEGAAKILLLNGTVQQFNYETERLNTVAFDTLAFDLEQFATKIPVRASSLHDFTTPDYLARRGADESDYDRAYLHDRFVKPLLAMLVPIIGMATLLIGGFTRSSIIFRIIIASVLTLSVDFFRAFCQSIILKTGASSAVAYLPVLLLIIVIFLVLAMGSHDLKTLRRARTARRAGRLSGRAGA